VTEYDLTTNPGVDIYYEIKTYTAANTPAVLAAYATYLLDADINSNVEIQVNPSYTLVFYGYLGHVSAPTDFDSFSDIPVASTIYPPTNGSLTELLLTIGSTGLTSEGVSYSGTFSFKVTGSTFLQDTYSTYLEAAASLPSGAVLSYVPQGVIPNLVTQGKSQNGGNLLGLEATPQICMYPLLLISIRETYLTKVSYRGEYLRSIPSYTQPIRGGRCCRLIAGQPHLQRKVGGSFPPLYLRQ
jgi:hypothetical protein